MIRCSNLVRSMMDAAVRRFSIESRLCSQTKRTRIIIASSLRLLSASSSSTTLASTKPLQSNETTKTKTAINQQQQQQQQPPPQPPPPIMTLYDSLTQKIQGLPAGKQGSKGIACYTCGPTTYAPAHLGHARTYVCLDIMRRVLEYASRIQGCSGSSDSESSSRHMPLFVMNITDVDDKILAAAAETCRSPLDLARHYEAEFWKDLDALNCLRPHVVTRVTEHVESDIIPYIEQLVDSGMAYTNIMAEDYNDGDSDDHGAVYFDVRAFEDKMQNLSRYGKLAPPSASTDFYNRVEQSSSSRDESSSSSTTASSSSSSSSSQMGQAKKRDDRDFALWKPRKEGESMYWDSPWGKGRPGWHIECSAMIQAVQQRFDETHVFAIHAGGVDLKFPHHTNEIAQAEAHRYSSRSPCSTVNEWIPHWVHTGHLHIDGLKMSKSLKNFVTIEELLTNKAFTGDVDSKASPTSLSSSTSPLSCPADDFRLWCLGLSGSYRGPATFSRERILEAQAIRQKIVQFFLQAQEWLSQNVEQRHGEDSSPKKWQESDYQLFQTTSAMSAKAMNALLYNDLDGSAFVRHIVQLSEAGTAHLQSVPPGQGPTEVVYSAIDTLQSLLSLVGFTDATTCVSLRHSARRADAPTSSSNGGVVVGGERALLDEFVRFRNTVRQIALRSNSKTDGDNEASRAVQEKMRDIMQLCDDSRDYTFPALGVELLDERVHQEKDEAQSNESSSSSSWRFCLPRTRNASRQEDTCSTSSKKAKSKEEKKPTTRQDNVPLEDLFRLGKQYAGQFSSFDEEGFPTLHADGSEISNRLRKKLLKKRAAYAKRLAAKSEGHGSNGTL